MRDAVAVREDQVVSRGGLYRFIADCRSPEAAVLVPDMPDGKRRAESKTFNNFRRLGTGTVIGDDKLVRKPFLEEIAVQYPGKVIRSVIGGDDQGSTAHDSRSCNSSAFM